MPDLLLPFWVITDRLAKVPPKNEPCNNVHSIHAFTTTDKLTSFLSGRNAGSWRVNLVADREGLFLAIADAHQDGATVICFDPDVNGDGVQLHLRGERISSRPWNTFPLESGESRRPLDAAWIAIPEADGRIRAREIAGSGLGWVPDGGWQRMPDGYRMLLHLPLERLGSGPRRQLSLDVLVNESAPGRERRRGQLVLSGARGEWVYLRGDRQPADRLLPFLIDDA